MVGSSFREGLGKLGGKSCQFPSPWHEEIFVGFSVG